MKNVNLLINGLVMILNVKVVNGFLLLVWWYILIFFDVWLSIGGILSGEGK